LNHILAELKDHTTMAAEFEGRTALITGGNTGSAKPPPRC